ncbi:MAG: M4 family metallopeptidase, partial [Clostridiales bacterium]|nr:M4 family metallopeptidase [Clostridiales bacterium]
DFPYESLATNDEPYYVYANDSADGEDGDIAIVIDNLVEWASATVTSQDTLGTTRTFNMQYDDESDTYRMVDSTRNITTYTADVSGLAFWKKYSLPGTIVTTSLDEGTYYVAAEAVSVQANMSDVYDFYKNTLNRDSFDGAGAAIKVSYDYGDNYENAYWSSSLQQMVYGDAGGFSSALDVAGHEFTHAVINYVVGDGVNTTLTYYGESGALNESYADIMGTLIENKSGTDRWLIGEDSDSAIRSLSSPSTYGQPESYDDLYTGSSDNAGVHTNSGIFNYAAYKMMTDSRTSSISNSTWAKMFYGSMFRLATDADFLDARYAVLASAKALGFTSSQVEAIEDAFDDVGIKESDSIRIVLT